MTIYLGSSGHVELQRPTTEWMRTTVNNPDINVNQRRFSVNFYGDQDGAANTSENVVVLKTAHRQKTRFTTSSPVIASPSERQRKTEPSVHS